MMVMTWLLLVVWLKFMIFLLRKKSYDFGRVGDLWNKIKENEEKDCFFPPKQNRFPKCIRVLTRKPSYGDCIELNDGYGRILTVMTELTGKPFCE